MITASASPIKSPFVVFNELLVLLLFPSQTHIEKHDIEIKLVLSFLWDTIKEFSGRAFQSPRFCYVIIATMSNDDDTKNKISPKPLSTEEPFEIVGRAIFPLLKGLDEYAQFEPVPEDVVDVAEEFSTFRHSNGSLMTDEIAKTECILMGRDKSGLSMTLGVPVEPGATLSVIISTWVNPCHSGFAVSASKCFGIGMVPCGTAKEESWIKDDFETSRIKDGVQFYGEVNMRNVRLAAMLDREDPVCYKFQVVQNDQLITDHNSFCGPEAKMSLDPVHGTLARDINGDSVLIIKHNAKSWTVKRKSSNEMTETGEHKSMELFLNCLGWPDNNTYVRFEKVSYTPPTHTSDE